MKIKLSSFVQWRINLFLYKRLGWKLTYQYLQMLGSLYYFVNRKERVRIEESIEEVFKGIKDDSQISTIKKHVFQGVLSHYYEKIFNAYEDLNKLKDFFCSSIRTKGNLERLDKGLSRGKGILFVTGHYGGIEYIPIFLALKGYPISVIAKFSTRQLKETLYGKTKDLGLKILDPKEEKQILNQIIRELKNNRIVFFECDEIEEWKPSKKESLFFLNKRVGVDKTIGLIQRRTDTVVIFGVLHRVSLDEYLLILNDCDGILHSLGSRSYPLGAAILKYFEKLIYIHPEAWYQWKKYADLQTSSPLNMKTSRGGTLSIQKQAYDSKTA